MGELASKLRLRARASELASHRLRGHAGELPPRPRAPRARAAAAAAAAGDGSAAASAPAPAPFKSARVGLRLRDTTPPEKSSSAVSSAGDGFLPTIQNSNSGDAAWDGEDLPESHSGIVGGGSAPTASAIAAAVKNTRDGTSWRRPVLALAASRIWAAAAAAAMGDGFSRMP